MAGESQKELSQKLSALALPACTDSCGSADLLDNFSNFVFLSSTVDKNESGFPQKMALSG